MLITTTLPAHAVRHTDLLGDSIMPTVRPLERFAFFRGPLIAGRKPFVFASAMALARHIASERGVHAIRLLDEPYRRFASSAPMQGVTIYRVGIDGGEDAIIGWAWLGGGRQGRALLQAALYEIDPPVAGDLAEAC